MESKAPSPSERAWLEVRAAELAAKDRPADPGAVVDELDLLLRSFDGANANFEDAKLRLAAYTSAVAGFPLWAIRQAVRGFIGGGVDRRTAAFAPSPPEFAIEVRRLVQPFRVEAYDIKRLLVADIYREVPEAERQRVEEGFAKLARDCALAADPFKGPRAGPKRVADMTAAEAEAHLEKLLAGASTWQPQEAAE